MDEFEFRENVIDNYTIYDLVELLNLSVEDLIDKMGILEDDTYRSTLIEDLYD